MQVTGTGNRWEFMGEDTIFPVRVEKREIRLPVDTEGPAAAEDECANCDVRRTT
jgi:hypothetical protein